MDELHLKVAVVSGMAENFNDARVIHDSLCDGARFPLFVKILRVHVDNVRCELFRCCVRFIGICPRQRLIIGLESWHVHAFKCLQDSLDAIGEVVVVHLQPEFHISEICPLRHADESEED